MLLGALIRTLLHTRDQPPAPECTWSLPASSRDGLTGLSVSSKFSGESIGSAQLQFQGLQAGGKVHLKVDGVAFPPTPLTGIGPQLLQPGLGCDEAAGTRDARSPGITVDPSSRHDNFSQNFVGEIVSSLY